MDVKFKNLTIKSFRGIGDALTFDLSSPLTLIYAPNGTGKTTLCEAAEWMLTGRVERLATSQIFNSDILKSRFVGTEYLPEVAAELAGNGNIKFLNRRASNAQGVLRAGSSINSVDVIPDIEWARLLSSNFDSIQDQLAVSSQTVQRWIRGSRFLTTDDLSSLMDTDEFSAEKRMQVFSDILGVRHLYDAKKTLDEHLINLVNQESGFLKEYRLLEVERKSLIDKESGSIKGVTFDVSSFESELKFVEDQFGILRDASSDLIPISRRVSVLDSKLVERERDIVEKIALAEHLDVRSRRRSTDEGELERQEIIYHRLVAEINFSRSEIASCEQKIADLQSETHLLDEKFQGFVERRPELEVGAKSLTNEFGRCAELLKLSETVTVGRLQRTLEKRYISTGEDGDAYLLKMHHILGRELPGLRAEIKIAIADKKGLVNNVISGEQEAQLQHRLDSISIELKRYYDQIASAEKPAALRSEVKRYLSHHHAANVTDCPVCGHDYGENQTLLAALTSAMDALPNFIQTAKNHCRSLDVEKDELDNRLRISAQSKDGIQDLEFKIAALTSKQNLLLSELESHGVTEKNSKDLLDKEMARQLLQQRLNQFVTAASAVRQYFPDIGDLSEYSVAEVSKNVMYHLKDYQRQIEHTALALRESMVRERHQVNGLRAKLELKNLEFKKCESSLSQIRRQLDDFLALWEKLGDGVDWSDDVFASRSKSLLEQKRSIVSLRKMLDSVRRRYVRDASMNRVESLDQQIRALGHVLKKSRNEITLTNQTKNEFEIAYKTFSTQRLASLADTVAPLFQRMHSNRVYDSIGFDSNHAGVILNAESGGNSFSPDRDFSQGQRQDLALAIFLARARAVGGTFFLDEPVMHLDDLNRVALLDILRAFTIENADRVNLVVTTSSKAMARHMIQKFSSVGNIAAEAGGKSALKVYSLEGNSRVGVIAQSVYG